MTLDEYVTLPEIESALCPECDQPGLFLGMIGVCNAHDEPVWWRWPGVVGMD